MTIIDRAVRLIKLYGTRNGSPRDVALELAAAGLLKSDLPEPDDPGIFVPDGKGWLPCGPDGPSVWTAPDSLIMVQRIEPGDLTPEEAEALGLALLAAAQHAKEHHAS